MEQEFSSHWSKGGRKRAEKMTPEQRREIARGAAKARWSPGHEKPKRAPTAESRLKEVSQEIESKIVELRAFLRSLDGTIARCMLLREEFADAVKLLEQARAAFNEE